MTRLGVENLNYAGYRFHEVWLNEDPAAPKNTLPILPVVTPSRGRYG